MTLVKTINAPTKTAEHSAVLGEVRSVLRRHYDLDGPVKLEQYFTGHFHATYRATAATSTYVVRISRLRSQVEVVAELGVLTALLESPFRPHLPALVRTCSGNTCVQGDSGVYAVFRPSEGEFYRFSHPALDSDMEMVTSAVSNLLALHRAFDSLSDAALAGIQTQRQAIDRMLDVALLEGRRPTNRLVAPLLASQSSFLKEAAASICSDLDVQADKPFLIHGDFTFRNLLWQRNGSAVVLDFDLVQTGSRWFDMVKLIDRLFIETADVAAGISANHRSVTRCLASYWSACSEEERRVLRCGTDIPVTQLRYASFQELWAVLLIDELDGERKLHLIRRDIDILRATCVARQIRPLVEIWKSVLEST